jgi:hypothetical protein
MKSAVTVTITGSASAFIQMKLVHRSAYQFQYVNAVIVYIVFKV